MDSDYTGDATKLEPTAEQIEALRNQLDGFSTDELVADAAGLNLTDAAGRAIWLSVANMVLTAAAKAVVSDAAGNRDFNQGLLHAEAVLKALRGDK